MPSSGVKIETHVPCSGSRPASNEGLIVVRGDESSAPGHLNPDEHVEFFITLLNELHRTYLIAANLHSFRTVRLSVRTASAGAG